MFKSTNKFIVISVATFLFSSCQFFKNKDVVNKSKTETDTFTAIQSEFPLKENRKLAQDSKTPIKCDLDSDKCNGKPLDPTQTAKTFFLADQVAEKLLEIERTEKLAGRDFKVALIGRRGSKLSKFQPLKDKDANGQVMTVDQLVQTLVQQSQNIPNSGEGGNSGSLTINPMVMRDYFDRSRNLKYSHLGIAVKNLVIKDKDGKIRTNPENGHWAIVHLLYSCEDSKRSYVFKGTLAHFFYDHLFEYGAEILVPEQTLQNNVEKIIKTDYSGNNWIEKQYNAIALSNDLNQQNSNQWVLEVLAAAMFEPGTIKDRAQAQAALRATNYHETKVTPTGLYTAITIPLVSKMISNIMPTVCMMYQPNIQKYGIGEIISALSLEEYLLTNKRLQASYEVELTKQDTEDIDKDLALKKEKQKTNHN